MPGAIGLAGTDYAFRLDGGEPLADPRSPRQPSGPAGPSRTYDHSAFAWTDDRWRGAPVPGAVIYELHVGTFTPEGTLDAAIGRLDHLVDLGVTVVELMPVAAFPGDHGWGYDGIGLWAVHEPYGGPDALKRFVDACHARGLAVYLDVVYNHVGPGNRLASFGPYFTDAHLTPWGPAVNLDQPGSDEVRAFFVDNALMWLRDYHLDGLRLDAVHALVDTRALHILEELAVAVDAFAAAAGRSIVLVAESDLNNPRLITARQAGGFGLDAQWNDDFHHAVHALVTGERQGYYSDFGSLSGVAKTLTRAYFHDGTWSAFRGRTHGRPVDTRETPAYRFVVFDQDHDQVGNRAVGDRLPPRWPATRTGTGCSESCPACCSPRPARRCCSWARSGAPTRRGSSSPTTPIPGWRRRSAPAAGRSSPPTAGERPTSPTRRTRRRSSAPSSTGTSPAASRTVRCSAGTAPCCPCAGPAPNWPTRASTWCTSTTTRTPAGCSSAAASSASPPT